jgi:NAD dependent epimerase/dehydratase family enzyme
MLGEMASMVTEGQRVVPARALALGFDFEHVDLDDALQAALRPSADPRRSRD